MRRSLRASALACLLVASACDLGPKGPGELTGRVTSGPIPVGAIVLEFAGAGITGFSETGSTRLFFRENSPGQFRVLMVTPAPGEMSFQIQVQDVDAPFPSVTTVQAVGGDNGGIANLTGIKVEVRR